MKTKKSIIEDNINLSDLEIDNDSVDNNEKDEDICSESELEKQFNFRYHLACEKAISLSKDYILDITGDNDSRKIGSALSHKTCVIHTITETSLVQVNNLANSHSKRISNIRFNPTNSQLFFSGSLDGTINVWDLRQNTGQSAIHILQDKTNGSPKPITCFDISENGKLLCAGTELVGGDAFILFWDIRKIPNLLGGYWQSHSDNITKVRFHKTKDLLASSSTDGLVNVYDISEPSEHQALIQTLNTESSVEKIDWFTINRGQEDAIHCITNTECIGLWKIDDGDFYKKYSRERISQSIFKKSKEDAYIANIHDVGDDSDQLFLVAGSNKGRAECLRTLNIDKNDGSISPRSLLIGNKQIVRSTWFDSKTKMLISGGECSVLSVWRPGSVSQTEREQNIVQASQISDSKLLKNTSKIKNFKNKMTPY